MYDSLLPGLFDEKFICMFVQWNSLCSGTCIIRPGRSYEKHINLVIYLAQSLQNHVCSPCCERPPATKSCLFSLLWETTCLERPQNLVVALYRFHCNMICYNTIVLNSLRLETKWLTFYRKYFQIHFLAWKLLYFLCKFHWNLIPKVQIKICDHWFRWWLGAKQVTSH